MDRIDEMLRICRLYGVAATYFRAILELGLELGSLPVGVYRLAALRTNSTEAAVAKCVEQWAPKVWERGTGVFHRGQDYESAISTLSNMLLKISGGKCL